MNNLVFKTVAACVFLILGVYQIETRSLAQRAMDGVSNHKVHVAENYIHEKMFNRRFDDVIDKLDLIFEKIEKKQDK